MQVQLLRKWKVFAFFKCMEHIVMCFNFSYGKKVGDWLWLLKERKERRNGGRKKKNKEEN